MQWDESKNAGFTTGAPWLRCNPNYTIINAKEALTNRDSIFYYYQKLISLRKSESIFTEGVYELLQEENENIFAYTRETEKEKLLVLCNFRGKEVSCVLEQGWKDGEVLIANYDGPYPEGVLRPYEAKIIKKIKEGFHA